MPQLQTLLHSALIAAKDFSNLKLLKLVTHHSLFLFILLQFSVVHAQKMKSGTATYAVTVIENKDSKLEKMMLEMNANAHAIVTEFSFTLEFEGQRSLFYFDEKLYSDPEAAKIGLLKLRYTGEILQTNDSIFKSYKFADKKNLVGSEKNRNWIITTETKKIGNFLCYKATLIDVVENSKGRFEHPVIAWFCPEIPYNFGPLKFGGLPGLIVELQTKDAIFGLTELRTDVKNKKLKAFDSTKTKISEEELNEIIKLSN